MSRVGYHHGDLRASLLASALELVETAGPEQLSLRAVAREAGVSPNAPYNHYADKAALLAALALHGLEQVRESMVAAAAAADPGDEIFAITAAAVRHALARPGLYRLTVAHMCGDDPRIRAAEDAVRAVVAGGVAATTGGSGADALCAGVWALAQGLTLLLVDGALKPAPHQTVDDFVRATVQATLTAGAAAPVAVEGRR
ncbi:TetR/AcrR family transcriptional regulator [Umezawaea endophytica]|uniref:TetR/AcrR family transcriptional regulator n=1 Tax=Umezawaea endophytica TaxID=1654476 RepID=A0A9X2VUN1_9PSEU|nr:TetR/AcrR family transcriptional regulator [Umezawaea endophytica]MCS7483153.1 TetR/AcrR family transcriptional regulator [Umezawaea endophytica]